MIDSGYSIFADVIPSFIRSIFEKSTRAKLGYKIQQFFIKAYKIAGSLFEDHNCKNRLKTNQYFTLRKPLLE
ncbi:hypothetical protein DC20_02735 [Rufibacter tibetensis]|uniref:Uncharacterized protein n=1 Tax=Rufibacter tibetensis TaxID=512763 RepID=A0A0P0CUP2_9BACT|nr:hypothetical protein DC20_02735 [Rufibacter tibetensis]